MDKRKKRKYIRIAAFVFWIILAYLARSQQFKLEKDPLIYSIVVVSFFGYLVYEHSYRLPKISETKKKAKEYQLASLLKDSEKLQANINPDHVPLRFHSLIGIVKRWGIENKILRENLFDSADRDELLSLKEIENQIEDIHKWIKKEGEMNEEKKAFKLTIAAYNDLGLWTWNQENGQNSV